MLPIKYWPPSERVKECIRTEAETADESVLLAVHQEARLIQRWAQSGREESVTEGALLEALLTDETDGSAVLVPITGPSGVGKSHMIRWLRAQLRRHKKFPELHIIDIPKTASLRQVIELILQPLRGEDYVIIRREFQSAISRVSESDAAQLLATNLSLILKRKATEFRAQLGNANLDRQQQRALQERVAHAQQLPFILQDIFFAERLAQPALIRVVKRALQGSSADPETAPGEEQPQFEDQDLILPSQKGVTEAAKEAQKYYVNVLSSQDGRQRQIAVNLLNDCIDEALRGVFRFSQTLGSKTIEDIFDEIRRQLLKDGKELVLLIEDFASLSGIQEPLLKLCIAETEREGKQVRAQLRTAIALTDGFAFQRDTILTRAKREWVIQSKYSTADELIEQCIDLAGRYLNAARWGRDELHKQFAEAARSGKTVGLNDWVKAYRDHDNDAEKDAVLRDFGFTKQDYSLFPFNRLALKSFCESALRQGGALSFNPRIFINAVLQRTLGFRQLFLQKEFPPAEFLGGVLAPDVAARLKDVVTEEDVRGRLQTLIIHWCGNPRRFEELAQQPATLFQVFGLKRPVDGSDRRAATPTDVTGDAGTRQTTAVAPPPEGPRPELPPDTSDVEATLDTWVDKGELGQNDARTIRRVLADAVSARIDFPQLRISKVDIRPDWFFIPGARTGNPTQPPILKLAESRSDKDGAIRKALLALKRHEIHGSWDYVNAETDYAYATQLVDRLTGEIEEWLLNKATGNLSALVERLEIQSRIVGTLAVEKSSFKSRLQALFEQVPPLQPTQEQRNEDETKALDFLAAATKYRPLLIERVLENCKCTQGERGAKAMALDIARIERAMRLDNVESPVIDGELKAHFSELSGGNLSRHLSRLLRVTRNKVKSIEAVVSRTDRLETLAREIRELVGSAFTQNLRPDSLRPGEMEELCNRLSHLELKEVFEVADALPPTLDDKRLGKVASVVGKVKLQHLVEAAELLDRLSSAAREIETKLRAKEAVAGPAGPQDPRKILEVSLARTESLLSGGADDTP